MTDHDLGRILEAQATHQAHKARYEYRIKVAHDHGHTMQAIADTIGINIATVSRIVNKNRGDH